VTGGDSAAAVLQTNAAMMNAAARVIASVHITLALLWGKQRRGTIHRLKHREIIADSLTKPDGVGAASQRLIPTGEQSGLLTRIGTTQRGLSFVAMRSNQALK
jgi:hypothetical protein